MKVCLETLRGHIEKQIDLRDDFCGGAVYIVFLALYFLIVTYQLDTGTVYLSTNAMQVRWWAAPVAPA